MRNRKTFFFTVLCLFVLKVASSKAYWQQHVDTRIAVSLDDTKHFLHGFETLVYTNNSPDTLRYVFIHLWPNAYHNDRTAFSEQLVQQGRKDFYFAKEEDRGYIDSLHFTISEREVDFIFVGHDIDIAKIELPKPLLPGDAITIETPFRVKIPKVFSRLGHNQQAYFISQWFPKPAVYDHEGWHPMPYLDQGEFYSEIGDYKVEITLPENYIVMATGNCTTPSENVWMDSLAQLALPPDTLYRHSFPPSAARYKTITFEEKGVHDFAWFADKRWILRQDTVLLQSPDMVKKVMVAYLPEHQVAWEPAPDILKMTMRSYSDAVGMYPYPTLKTVEGDMIAGSGMEYPTVAVIRKEDYKELPVILVHEAGHNWFYGMLASNERAYPWMDEGLNTFYERKTMHDWKRNKKKIMDGAENTLRFILQSFNTDQAADLPATAYTSLNYGGDVYHKTADFLEWLEQYIGEADFRKGMKGYFAAWRFKHPYPEDFRSAMQHATPKDLGWFFDSVFHSVQKIEVKLDHVQRRGKDIRISIKNKSGFSIPVPVSVMKGDSVLETTWVNPFVRRANITLKNPGDWDKISIGPASADYKLANNHYARHALLHKWKLAVSAGTGMYRDEYHRMYVAYSLGYNAYDGFGMGPVFHNLSMPQYRLQFALAPMFSFGSRRVNGAGGLSYSWFPRKTFREIRAQLSFKTFSQGSSGLNISEPLYARYIKFAPSLEFTFKEREVTSPVKRSLLLKQYNISEQSFGYRQDFTKDSLFRPFLRTSQNTYFLLRYTHVNKRAFHSFSYVMEAQAGESFVKLNVTADWRIDYDVKGKSLYIRPYAGKFFATGTAATDRYWLNTTFSGVNDYLYDGLYFGRNKNEGFGSQQVSLQEGGGKIPTNLLANPLGRSDNWLLSLNLKTDLPLGKLPLRLYVDCATFADAKYINPSGNRLLLSGGVELHLFSEVLSIYAPLFMSTDYKDYLTSMYPKDRLLNSISFSLNIQQFNFMRAHELAFRRMTE